MKMIKIFTLCLSVIIISLLKTEKTIASDNTRFYTYYGWYPQDVLDDNILYDDLFFLSDSYLVDGTDDCYLYNENYYVKYTTGVLNEDACFTNGNTILSNRVYFFKLQPVLWKTDENREYYYSDKIIDYVQYSIDNTFTYETTYGVTYLNEMFEYISKFNNNKFVPKNFNIDHSSIYQSASTSPGFVHFPDHEFLNSIDDRMAECTDYVLAKGIEAYSYNDKFYGEYWSSAFGSTEDHMMYVRADGELLYTQSVTLFSGIRPLIRGV